MKCSRNAVRRRPGRKHRETGGLWQAEPTSGCRCRRSHSCARHAGPYVRSGVAAANAEAGGCQIHGRRSWSRSTGWPAMRAGTLAGQARGLMSLNLAAPLSET